MADERYHRTFLNYNPGGPPVPAGTGHNRSRQPAWDPSLTNQPTGTVPPSPSSPYSRYYPPGYQPPSAPAQPYHGQLLPMTKQFNALVMGRGGIEPNQKKIWAKPDQHFNDVATEWERKDSELCYPTGPFSPVVDSTMLVIAHYGEVWESQLVSVPIEEGVRASIVESYLNSQYVQDCSHGSCWYHKPGEPYKEGGPIRGPNGDWQLGPTFDELEVQPLLAAEIPVYVRPPGEAVPEGWRALSPNEWNKWAVLALPDGEVVHAHMIQANASNNGTVVSSWAPWDVFSIGRLGAAIAGGIAKRILAQAGRLGYRLLAGPTKAVLQRIEAKIAQKYLIAQVKAGANPKLVSGYLKYMPYFKKITGTPDANVAADRFREMVAANRFAMRKDVEKVWLGSAAKKEFGSPAGDKFPDVIARKVTGDYLAAEGKGTDMKKAISQFQTAREVLNKQRHAITEFEVVVPPLKTVDPHGQPIHGIDGKNIVGSAGGGWGVNNRGYLVDMTGGEPWTEPRIGGIAIKVIVHQ